MKMLGKTMPMIPEEMRKAIIASLPAKTGRSLKGWIGLPKTKYSVS